MQPPQGRLQYECDGIRMTGDQKRTYEEEPDKRRSGNLCSRHQFVRLASLPALRTKRGTLDEVIQRTRIRIHLVAKRTPGLGVIGASLVRIDIERNPGVVIGGCDGTIARGGRTGRFGVFAVFVPGLFFFVLVGGGSAPGTDRALVDYVHGTKYDILHPEHDRHFLRVHCGGIVHSNIVFCQQPVGSQRVLHDDVGSIFPEGTRTIGLQLLAHLV